MALSRRTKDVAAAADAAENAGKDAAENAAADSDGVADVVANADAVVA
jgi:hypothetical protein